MATKAITTAPGPPGTAILEHLAELEVESMSPETARQVLVLDFDASHQHRIAALSEKAQLGTLSPAEDEELDQYIHVADLLAILQSRARRALKKAGPSS